MTKIYKVRIDRKDHRTKMQVHDGRSLLELAGKKIPDEYAIYQKIEGYSQPLRLGLDEEIDLADAINPRFITLPLQQTEG